MEVNEFKINIKRRLEFNENNSIVTINSNSVNAILLIVINSSNNTININDNIIEKIVINGNNNKINIINCYQLNVNGRNNYITTTSSRVNVVGNYNYLNVKGFDALDNLINIGGYHNIIKSNNCVVTITAGCNLIQANRGNIIDYYYDNHYNLNIGNKVIHIDKNFNVKFEYIETKKRKSCLYINSIHQILEKVATQREFDDQLLKIKCNAGVKLHDE